MAGDLFHALGDPCPAGADAVVQQVCRSLSKHIDACKQLTALQHVEIDMTAIHFSYAACRAA